MGCFSGGFLTSSSSVKCHQLCRVFTRTMLRALLRSKLACTLIKPWHTPQGAAATKWATVAREEAPWIRPKFDLDMWRCLLCCV